jgi:hypothetical protein
MGKSRIIDYEEAETLANDDYVLLDGITGGSKKILASELSGGGGGGDTKTLIYTLQAGSQWESFPNDSYTDIEIRVKYNYIVDATVLVPVANMAVYGNYNNVGLCCRGTNGIWGAVTIRLNVAKSSDNNTLYISTDGVSGNTIEVYV